MGIGPYYVPGDPWLRLGQVPDGVKDLGDALWEEFGLPKFGQRETGGAMKICAQCRHFRSHGNIWYDQYCTAVESERWHDPVSGKTGFCLTNDLGRKVFTEDRFPHARDINQHGDCELHEPS